MLIGGRGKVTVHFPLKTGSSSDVVITIPSSGCQEGAIKLTLPADVKGFVRQTVDITYESHGGRKSNAWSAEFNPRLVELTAPYYWVASQCSEESASDNCNNQRFGWCWNPSDGGDAWGELGYWPPQLDSMIGDHHGCWGFSSDDGTDVYTLTLATVGANGKPLTNPLDGWMASGFGGWSVLTDNAFAGNGLTTNGCPNQPQCFPATYVQAKVTWHIGASGGAIDYLWDIHIKGPAGVPLPLPGAAYAPYR
jgi:hypothetical protein